MDINDLKALFRFQRKAEPKPKGSGKIRFSLYAAGRNGRAIRRGSAEEIRSPAEY